MTEAPSALNGSAWDLSLPGGRFTTTAFQTSLVTGRKTSHLCSKSNLKSTVLAAREAHVACSQGRASQADHYMQETCVRHSDLAAMQNRTEHARDPTADFETSTAGRRSCASMSHLISWVLTALAHLGRTSAEAAAACCSSTGESASPRLPQLPRLPRSHCLYHLSNGRRAASAALSSVIKIQHVNVSTRQSARTLNAAFEVAMRDK